MLCRRTVFQVYRPYPAVPEAGRLRPAKKIGPSESACQRNLYIRFSAAEAANLRRGKGRNQPVLHREGGPNPAIVFLRDFLTLWLGAGDACLYLGQAALAKPGMEGFFRSTVPDHDGCMYR